MLERAEGIGGTWFYNSYLGAACDVPSHLYSFSYAQRRDWSRLCSPRREIFEYVHEVAHDLGIDRLVVTRSVVAACRWDDATSRWGITTERGEVYESDAIVIATGLLHKPSSRRGRHRCQRRAVCAGDRRQDAEADGVPANVTR